MNSRQQLLALQFDMGMVMTADPYKPQPLDDTSDEVNNRIEEMNAATPYPVDAKALSCKYYHRFVNDVNDAQEQRDVYLTMLAVSHTRFGCTITSTWKERATLRSYCDGTKQSWKTKAN